MKNFPYHSWVDSPPTHEELLDATFWSVVATGRAVLSTDSGIRTLGEVSGSRAVRVTATQFLLQVLPRTLAGKRRLDTPLTEA